MDKTQIFTKECNFLCKMFSHRSVYIGHSFYSIRSGACRYFLTFKDIFASKIFKNEVLNFNVGSVESIMYFKMGYKVLSLRARGRVVKASDL